MQHASDRSVRRGRGIVLVLATCSLLAGVVPATAAEAEAPAASMSFGQLQIRPTSGPGGTRIDVRARELRTQGVCQRLLQFIDSAGTVTGLGSLPFSASFRTTATTPVNAAPGLGTVHVHTEVRTSVTRCDPTLGDPSASFTVIGGPRRAGMSSAHIQVQPTSGPGGAQIGVRARGLSTYNLCYRNLDFEDSAGAVTTLQGGLPFTDSFWTRAIIPATAAVGPGSVYIQDVTKIFGQCFEPGFVVVAKAAFTVT